MRIEILHQHRLPRVQRRLQFGVAIELNGEILQRRIFERRHHDRLFVARSRKHHGTMRHAKGTRGAADEEVKELRDREVAGDFVQNIHQRAPTVRILLRAHQRLLGAGQRAAGGTQHRPRPELHLHPRQQLFRAIRLADEIRGPQPQGAHRGLFRRLRRQHQHRDVTPALLTLDAFEQLTPVGIRHEDVEQQEVRRTKLQLFQTGHPTVGRDDLVSVFLQQPGHRFKNRHVIVGD